MLAMIQMLLYGHVHKWKIIEERPLTVNRDFGSKSTGNRYYVQCEKCGTIKKRDLA